MYTIRNEKAKRGHDLIEIGNMPALYRDLFGLSGNVYVSNEHLYRNMVSRAAAEAEGRFNSDASADYHELGEEKVINAIEQFQDPLVIMESLKDFNEPRLVAILDEKGNDGQNLIAVMELYAPIAYPGKNQRRNHVLITIYEKTSLPDYIEKTGDKDRILHIKEGLQQTRQAGLQLAGAVSKETLAKNVARFNKKVKAFKENNKIYYSEHDTDYSNRDLLANAFEGITMSSAEYKLVQEYKGRIRILNEQEEKLSKLNAEIRDIRFTAGKYDAKKLKELETEAKAVANAMSKMFNDGKLVERLAELKAQDKNLAQKLWEGFKEILAKFLGLYEKQGTLFRDADVLVEMKETFEQLQNMFAEALVEASENYQASLTPGVEGTVVSKTGEVATQVKQADRNLEQYASQETDLDMDDAADYDSIGLDDIKDIVKKGTGIKWNNGNVLTLGKAEYAAVVSRISTRYHSMENHGGVQYIE